MRHRTIMLVLGGTIAAAGAHAQPNVFRCVDATGRSAYQSTPCTDGRQTEVKLPAEKPVRVR